MTKMNIPKMMSIEELRAARRKEADPVVTERSRKVREDVKTSHAKEEKKEKRNMAFIQQKKRYLCLQGVKGVYAGKEFPLTDVLIIGRDPQRTNIVYPPKTPGISRQHCCIWAATDGTIKLQDLNSSHGTYFQDGSELGSQKVYRLRVGEKFYLASPKEVFCVVMREKP